VQVVGGCSGMNKYCDVYRLNGNSSVGRRFLVAGSELDGIGGKLFTLKVLRIAASKKITDIRE